MGPSDDMRTGRRSSTKRFNPLTRVLKRSRVTSSWFLVSMRCTRNAGRNKDEKDRSKLETDNDDSELGRASAE
jgi:hypothetical protein